MPRHRPPAQPRATDNLGPHLLGRKVNPRDDRDWEIEKLLALSVTLQRNYTPNETLQQLANDPAFDVWSMSLLWNFIQKLRHPQPPPQPPTPPPGPVGGIWPDTEPTLDQGQTPKCVGYCFAQWANTMPVDDHWTNADGDRVYAACKVLDGDQSDGTSSRSGAQTMVNMGRAAGYAFAKSLSDIDFWLATKGSVPTGTFWYTSMFQPDSDGLLHPTGSVAGGHEWLLVGQEVRVGKPCYKMHQSWGNWGAGGYAWIAKAEYEVLFRAQGDATLILELPLRA